MADDEKRQSDSEQTSEKLDEEYDPTLDFLSDQFDPVKALTNTTKRINIPVTKTCKFNSFARLGTEHELLTVDIEQREIDRKANMNAITNAASGSSGGVEPSNTLHEATKRRFLPHQEPVKSTRVVNYRNVLTRMTTCEGPLNFLQKCLEERKKVKIITRHGYGIRGYVTGYVEAFDKHLNVSLADVTEVWTRKKSEKIAPLGAENTQKRITRQVSIPKVTILKSEKKTELCQRNVAKIMMRGEHVVLISTINSTSAMIAHPNIEEEVEKQ